MIFFSERTSTGRVQTINRDAPNPFINFRGGQSESESEVEDSEEALCVYRQLQIGDSVIVAVMLMSNGAKVAATRYSVGIDGFIVCHWENPDTLETDVPNMFLAPGGEFIMKPLPPEPQTGEGKQGKDKGGGKENGRFKEKSSKGGRKKKTAEVSDDSDESSQDRFTVVG